MRLHACLIFLFATLPVAAKVTEREASQLRARLTPMGAERAGNAEGTIPEWRGGLTAPPPCHVEGNRYCNPYADDQPYAVINGDTLEKWLDFLSPAQIEMVREHPSFSMPVYPTRRSFANPGAVYEAAYRNAIGASLLPSGNGVRDAATAVPFPIPKDGVEPIWNHKLRYRGTGYSRWVTQATVTQSGGAHVLRMREDVGMPYAGPEGAVEDGIALKWLQVALQPERIEGFLSLIHEPANFDAQPQKLWRQLPGPRRMRLEKTYGYDSPAILSENLRTDDQLDTYFGSPERYLWRIADKREMVVPYNAYAAHSGRVNLRELIRPAHLNPALTRYEVHRVWVIEASLKPNATHRYKRRTFYIDEDSWQILMVDLYDNRDRLWRSQEVHTIMAYDRATLIPAVEVSYELGTRRYLVLGIDEGDPERVEIAFDPERFTLSGARDQAPR
ncbi:DUF1329 domain-containing protein [Panacagrimonas sp.]|uniref:DUF1329 domain-containing protein n=1 Tax=Panacagrimonas sp. TaxID=2480088 RepID=UPI003B522B61